MKKDINARWEQLWEGRRELNVSTTIPGYKDFRNKLRLKRRKMKKPNQKKNEIVEQLPSITFGSKNPYPVSRCVLRN